MILTLFITVLVEGIVVTGYAAWRHKPIRPLVMTSICANLFTQTLLWIGVNLFFDHYLITLLVAEILIWITESLFLNSIPANQLILMEAILLSLGMNLSSIASGWLLPV